MESTISALRIPYHHLIGFFSKTEDKMFHLDTSIGDGEIQVFNLEEGLQARIWDCMFHQGIELVNEPVIPAEQPYYTLAFFADTSGLQLINNKTAVQVQPAWNYLLLSAVSDYQLHILPNTKMRCLSISFSSNWLNRVLITTPHLKNIANKIQEAEKLSLAAVMDDEEREQLYQLLEMDKRTPFQTFFIKSGVLKIMSDKFQKLDQSSGLLNTAIPSQDFLTVVESCLCRQINEPLPNLKALAEQFFMSECTLKRKFKERYGMTMSQYFLNRKMTYAKKLVEASGLNLKEVARRVGYKRVHNFLFMFQKTTKALLNAHAE